MKDRIKFLSEFGNLMMNQKWNTSCMVI